MTLVDLKAVVIKTQDFRENDKLVWLFSDKLGKVTAIAKGAKKSKSKILSITLPMCYGQYTLFQGKNLYTLSEGKIINSFQGLLGNLEKLTYSSYLCELIDICMQEKESNRYLFKEFITCLYLLNTDALDYELLIRSFELKLLKATGYNLNFDKCVLCGKPIKTSNYLSLSNFGGVCDACPKEHGMFISKAAYNSLRFLNKTPMDKIYRLNLTEDVKKEIFKITYFIISSNYVRRPKSLEMLNYIKE
ncbi:DNA repair protein RecO [Clostridium fallax]